MKLYEKRHGSIDISTLTSKEKQSLMTQLRREASQNNKDWVEKMSIDEIGDMENRLFSLIYDFQAEQDEYIKYRIEKDIDVLQREYCAMCF